MSGLRWVLRALGMLLTSAACGVVGTYVFYRALEPVLGWSHVGGLGLALLLLLVVTAEYQHRRQAAA